jgi:hypothetical protein
MGRVDIHTLQIVLLNMSVCVVGQSFYVVIIIFWEIGIASDQDAKEVSSPLRTWLPITIIIRLWLFASFGHCLGSSYTEGPKAEV